MAGFRNDVMYANNVDFSGAAIATATVTTDGQLLIGSTASPHIKVGTLTSSDSSITITPGSGTINLQSNPAVVPDLHVAKWIVNPTPNSGGNQTTIAAAIAAASSGDTIFITPGIYTENLTLKAGVNLTAFSEQLFSPGTSGVTIIGKSTFTGTGCVNISNIKLQTNSDFFLSVTGSSASIVNLENCFLNCSNNTGIQFTSSNVSTEIIMTSCFGDIGTTGISLYTDSSAGYLGIYYTIISNTGASSTPSTNSSTGTVDIEYSYMTLAVNTSTSTGFISARHSVFDTSALNVNGVTLAGTSISNLFYFCDFKTGGASSVSVGAGCTAFLYECIVNSSATNALTGAGTLKYGLVTFIGTSSTINTSTQVPVALTVPQGGTGLTAPGSSGNVLTSNGTIWTSTAPAPSGITTINGDSGSITGSTVTMFTNAAVIGSGSSIKFINSGTTSTLAVTDANSNTMIGSGNGNATISGTYNSSFGSASLTALTSGNYNVNFGAGSFSGLLGGNSNSNLGTSGLALVTTGIGNTTLGYNCGASLTSSESYNTYAGYSVAGVIGESNVTRIADSTSSHASTKCFIGGIAGVSVSNPSVSTINTSTGQLGNDVTNFTILSTGLQLKGNNTNTAPPAGFLGQEIRSAVTAVSGSNGVAANVTSITLTAGIWSVSGIVYAALGSTSIALTGGLSLTTGTIEGTRGDQYISTNVAGANVALYASIPSFRYSFTTNTVVYLVAQPYFTGGACSIDGRISGIRVG